jgi:hypothetical protein
MQAGIDTRDLERCIPGGQRLRIATAQRRQAAAWKPWFGGPEELRRCCPKSEMAAAERPSWRGEKQDGWGMKEEHAKVAFYSPSFSHTMK